MKHLTIFFLLLLLVPMVIGAPSNSKEFIIVEGAKPFIEDEPIIDVGVSLKPNEIREIEIDDILKERIRIRVDSIDDNTRKCKISINDKRQDWIDEDDDRYYDNGVNMVNVDRLRVDETGRCDFDVKITKSTTLCDLRIFAYHSCLEEDYTHRNKWHSCERFIEPHPECGDIGIKPFCRRMKTEAVNCESYLKSFPSALPGTPYWDQIPELCEVGAVKWEAYCGDYWNQEELDDIFIIEVPVIEEEPNIEECENELLVCLEDAPLIYNDGSDPNEWYSMTDPEFVKICNDEFKICVGTDIKPAECRNGCFNGDSCIPIGTRLERENVPEFCNFDGELKRQKVDGDKAENDYECVSNSARYGVCENVKEQVGIMNRMFGWLSRWFGN